MTLAAANGPRWVSPDGLIEIRQGRWQEVLADVEACDAVITDPPYSERTHKGHDAGTTLANRGTWKRSDGGTDICRTRTEINYSFLRPEDVAEISARWCKAARGWTCFFSDSDLNGVWREAIEAMGRTGFQPLPCVIPGMTVRLSGDGPSSWAVYLNVGRTKKQSKWGTLPGFYPAKQGEREHIGGKPLDLMRAIVRDYSRSGDLIVDPYAGGGTTLLAAAMEGRRSIGAECDPETFAKAVARLSRGVQADLFSGVAP